MRNSKIKIFCNGDIRFQRYPTIKTTVTLESGDRALVGASGAQRGFMRQ